MPMPHQTFAQLIRRRLVGKDGSARTRELRLILDELPDYKNGPYADLRKWVNDELTRTRVRSGVVHRDTMAVRREGAAQIAFVGAPNAGKSSLLQALSNVQIKTGDYAFTTTRPVPATTRIGGVLVQLVEIPGLIEGAADDRGGGKALLGVLRGADAIVYCHATDSPPEELDVVRHEVATAGIDKPSLVVATKADEGGRPAGADLAVSVLDDASLDRLRDAIWALTGLVRVWPGDADEPMALRPPVAVVDLAHAVHHDLGRACTGARIWGPSARFDGQHVGRSHMLADGDRAVIER